MLSSSRAAGTWIVDGSATGLGLADLLLGRVTSVEHGAQQDLPVHSWYVGAYAQDQWRATNRLTFNLGARWEPYLGTSVDNNAVYIFDIDRFRRGIRSSVFVNAPAGLMYPGDDGFPPGRTGLYTQWGNVSPRLGAAWDVTGDGRTAVPQLGTVRPHHHAGRHAPDHPARIEVHVLTCSRRVLDVRTRVIG